jgi:hypothetical protein
MCRREWEVQNFADFTCIKLFQLDRMLCDCKEKFTSLLGLNSSYDLFLQTAAIVYELAQPSTLERVLASQEEGKNQGNLFLWNSL